MQRLAGAWNIADTTLHVPHPYPDGFAEQWISRHAPALEAEEGITLAITVRDQDALCGAIGLHLNRMHSNAELGYWVGVPFWNLGLCTEAARAMLEYAFAELELHRVHASHLTRNPASGRVMQKLGMQHEGRLRGHIRKWGVFEDLEKYGILRSEWDAVQRKQKGAGDVLSPTPV